MRQVVFIGGTSFSGSTMLDLIVANDPSGFSCGEVYNLFYPYASHHHNPACGCGDSACMIWKNILDSGESRLYETIFDLFPEVDFITDSSKNPFWIYRQTQQLEEKGIKVKNILIWKDPLELAVSFKKRNRRMKDWERSWLLYHRLYLALVPAWKAVRYRDITGNPYTLASLCAYLAIPYREDKHEYWHKRHHTLFGNTSAKIHLYNRDSSAFSQSAQEFASQNTDTSSLIPSRHKTIYYDRINDSELTEFVANRLAANRLFNEISSFLSGDYASYPHNAQMLLRKLKLPFVLVQFLKLKRKLRPHRR